MRLIPANNCNSVTAGKFKHTFFYGFKQITLIVRMNEMGNHLCIRLTGEVIAEILQTLSNGLVIFNNAVVHETDESTGKVGVSIADFWCSMSGPSRMCNPCRSIEFFSLSR